MDLDHVQMTHMSQINATLVEMLTDRGIEDLPEAGFDDKHTYLETEDQNIHIIKVTDTKDIVKYLNSIVEERTENTLVILIAKTLGNDASKIVAWANNDVKIDIQIFTFEELQYNKTKHELVPKHTLIKSQDEINALVKKYAIKTVMQFPYILKTDPICKYYNGKPGNVMRVDRVSMSAGETTVYRVVV